MDSLWVAIGVVSGLIQIGLWLRELRPNSKKLTQLKQVGLRVFLLVVTVFAVYQAEQNRQLNDLRHEARTLLAKWPAESDLLDFSRDADLNGIVLGGLAFLDKHRDELGATRDDAHQLFDKLLNAPPQSADARHAQLEEAAGGMIGLIRSVADEPPPP